ncbi:MAG: histidine--tRNA ligase [Candidatus Omnitrophica bacterium]|nr:histidine--tRNA ligase [Candidatus Omnitrophota bacterium]
MKKTYNNIRGTLDFDASQALTFRAISDEAQRIFGLYGYQEIILPLLEEKDLFIRGVGQGTDIVERQMFKIEGKDVVLRPEGTAQVVRYYLQNSLHKKSDFHKFFYVGPMFRGERPQKGRLRQFHHLGAEAIGSDSFYLDAEMILLSLEILDSVGIKEKKLLINSLGCKKDKDAFSRLLKESLTKAKKQLCEDCLRRSEVNPLRVLDCKKEECRKQVKSFIGQDGSSNHLCSDCSKNYKNLTNLLKDLGVKYVHEPYLVRGLDYYTNTVFEITSSRLGAQSAIGAGGRYNNLIDALGGPSKPAIGFALGVERILLALDKKDDQPKVDVFIAIAGEDLREPAFKILNSLRKEGIISDYDYCQKSLKGQLRFAQKNGARYVVIVGDDEFKQGCVLLKDMEKGSQKQVKIGDLCSELTPAVN